MGSLDALLAKLAAGGLVKADGKQRTDSTHVVAAVAALNRLELAGEAVRAAAEALAAAHPAWLAQRVCVADWNRRYGTPMTSWRPPESEARREELAIAYARDGYALLEAVYDPSAPPWLRELPAVDVRRRVLVQNYTQSWPLQLNPRHKSLLRFVTSWTPVANRCGHRAGHGLDAGVGSGILKTWNPAGARAAVCAPPWTCIT